MLRFVCFILLVSLAPFQVAFGQAKAASPDGRLVVEASVKERMGPFASGERLYYAVQYKGAPVLLDSPFSLEFRGSQPFGEDVRIENVRQSSFNDTWQRVWGKRKQVRNQYNELRFDLVEQQEPNRKIGLVFRVYDDGVGLRYEIPEQPALSRFELAAEATGFHFAGDLTVWAADHGGYYSSQENEFLPHRLSRLDPKKVYGLPLLAKAADDRWFVVTEADLTDWAGMYLAPVSDARNMLMTSLSPRLDRPDVAVISQAPSISPWRVLMVGDRPGALIESDIVQNLNDPAEIENTSWIAPGKSAWDRWWSGSYAPEVDFEVGMNTETMKYFVDLAAEMGWEYQLVDWWWYGPPFAQDPVWGRANPDADITKVVPALDLPELVRYAGEKGVGILLWMHWKHAERQMEEAFPLYRKWGIKGVKIDFMDREDQEMVNFYHRTVKLAAENELLVDFHGAYKPTGWSRTYPNVITREGVLGNEYTKWSSRITPEHALTLPFTRGLLGEMDFTPGGFRHKTVENFRAVGNDAPGPFVMGTRAYQLAMMVVYESALAVLCDSPYNYRISPAGVDFLKIVPTTWDDTRVVNAQVSDYITVARRSGEEWSVGSMTDSTARSLKIPLSFLGEKKYRAEIWSDAYDAAEYPDRVMKSERIVTSGDVIEANMAPGGGQVIHLKPLR